MNFTRIALQQGLAAGGLIVIIQLFAYVIGMEVYLNPWVGNSRLIVVFAAMILANLAVKRESNETHTFKVAFYSSMIAATVSSLAAVLFHVMLAEWFDPEFYGKLVDAGMAEMQKSSVAKDAIRGLEGEIEKSLLWWVKPYGQIILWVMGLFVWSILALIIAAFMKHSSNSNKF